MKSLTIPPGALRFFELISPIVLAVFIPSVCLRAWAMDRAKVFNTGLHEEALWNAAPSLMAVDFLTAFLFGIALLPLALLAPKHRLWKMTGICLQAAICILAMLILATQYRVYRELGFYPNMNSFRHFAGPGSPFLKAAEFYFNWETLALIAFVLFCPLLVLIIAAYFRGRSGIALLALTVMFPLGWFWPIPQAAAALRNHPFQRFPPHLYDRPNQSDPEVSLHPPPLNSLCGLFTHDACREKFPQLSKPSIVFVLMESTGDQYLHENDKWNYPSLARMAASAIRFPWFYSPAGTSNPSVFCLLSSRHAIPSDEWWETREVLAEGTLPECLQAGGYATGMFMSGCKRFFFDGPLFEKMGWDTFLDGDDISKLDSVPKENRDRDSGVVDDAYTLTHLLKFTSQNLQAKRPTFSLLYTGLPHMPYNFLSKNPRAIHTHPGLSPLERYENQLAYVDHVLGRLYDELLAMGFFKNGLLIITGDHGQAFGQHGGYGHGTQVYDEVQRVPLLVVNPLLLKKSLCRTPGSHLDMAPTLLDLAGLQPGSRMDGTSLLADSGRAMIFIGAAHDKVKLGVVDYPYKAIYIPTTLTTELYRLDRDPAEKQDLNITDPELATRYRSWLKSYIFHYLTPPYMRNPPPAHRAFFEGRRAMGNGQSPSAAMGYFREALSIQPDFAEAQRLLAECHYRMGLDRAGLGVWDQAQTQFTEAVRLDPGHAAARLALCDIFIAADRRQDAFEILQAGRGVAPNDASIILRLAWLLATAHPSVADADTADHLLDSLILDDDAPPARVEVFAAVAAANGRFDQAIKLQENALAKQQARQFWGSPGPENILERLDFYKIRKPAPALPCPTSPLSRLPKPHNSELNKRG